MKTVSNSSPICYLRLIDQIDLLPALFGEIVIPEAVFRELSDKGAPQIVREWIEQPPAWLRIEKTALYPVQFLESLHAGEQEVIALAGQIDADLVLIDEKAARRTAKECGFNVTGLIGVLDEAATRSMVDATVAVERLSKTSFRVSPQLLKMLVDKHRFHQFIGEQLRSLNRKKILSASGLRRFLLPGSRREKDIEEILSALREKVGKLLAQGRTVILE